MSEIVDGYGRPWIAVSPTDPQPLPAGAFNGVWGTDGRLLSYWTCGERATVLATDVQPAAARGEGE